MKTTTNCTGKKESPSSESHSKPSSSAAEKSQNMGYQAELAAQRFLKYHGFKILHCNFRCKLGEIDIIGKENKTVVFVEVRYRKYNSYGSGAATVTRQKQKKIVKTAALYLQRFCLDVECRFDVIELQAKKTTDQKPIVPSNKKVRLNAMIVLQSTIRSKIRRIDNKANTSQEEFNDTQFSLHWIKNAFM